MSVKKILITLVMVSILPAITVAKTATRQSSAKQNHVTDTYVSTPASLGWIVDPAYLCGGFYDQPPLSYPVNVQDTNSIEITSDQTLFAQHGTSILEGNVTLTRGTQQMTANKAYLYRNTATGKLSTMDILGEVHLREPNMLAIARKAHYDFTTRYKTLYDVIYRTELNTLRTASSPASAASRKGKKITPLSAWGKADRFAQTKPVTYEMVQASFSTCPPINPAWGLKASHIALNKETGRGYATNARLLIKGVPVFYSPYIGFSIDHQRKSGFLWPVFGTRWGPYFLAPFYWNMAPNYDMTITPGILTKRGFQLTDTFRYLTTLGLGQLTVTALPRDQLFRDFRDDATARTQAGEYGDPDNPRIQAQLDRLLGDNTTRKAISWRDDLRFNQHWSSHVDFNYAGDDYYLRDFGNNLNEITQNQLLQEGDLYYKGPNWNFTGRLQSYQTLHPLDSPFVDNQYRRFPQLLLSADFPDQPLGLEFFIGNEATHFELLKSPGVQTDSPIGNRLHTQPGISLPIYRPSFFFNPRLQVALTDYNLNQTADTGTPPAIHRAVPIFDIASGVNFSKDLNLFSYAFRQTLEPQVYYTYIPYRDQSDIPVFDTTVNTLTYDQLFTYNRFTGIDRIGDANQIGVGVTTRLIDTETGFEKIKLGAGSIIYFANRLVTLCNNNSCSDNPENHSNYQRLSPISGVLNYNVNPSWGFTANAIWDPIQKQVNNSTLNLNYKSDDAHIVNLGFSFARNGSVGSGIILNTSANNLKLTDLSFSWPITHDINALGRWSQDWSQDHFQNLIYGLQYDTCCWAVRLVGSRTFTNLSQDTNTPQYDTIYYVQFDLKGLGNIGTGNPNGLLRSITGYNTTFGQDL